MFEGGTEGGIQREVLNFWGSQSLQHIYQSHYIKACLVYIILHKVCFLLPRQTAAICNLYWFAFQKKALLINLGFYCVSPRKAETFKLNVIAFDMGNGQ